MYRLLVVDDEPFTVDGLFEMLSDVPDLDLDLYRAYSAEEAMELLSRTKMDIVLSDMRMPEMDGLQLQQWIQSRWTRCKVIFLTGVSDLQHAQQAQRSGGVDYILKTEGDEAILSSIERAISAIQEDRRNENALKRAKEQLKEMLPLLRREWFDTLLAQDEPIGPPFVHRLRELDTPLIPEEDVLLVCGRVDRWSGDFNASDQALLLYAVQNVAEEYLEGAVMLPIMLGGSYFVWLIQSKDMDEKDGLVTANYVQGTLESIQQTCKQLLKVPVSFICLDHSVAWRDVAVTFKLLKQTLVLGLGNGEEMILLSRGEDPSAPVSEVPGLMLDRIENAIETGQDQTFAELLRKLFRDVPNRYSVYAQTYYSVAVILLGQWNKIHRSGNAAPANGEARIGRLLDVNGHKTKEEARQFLTELGLDLIQRGKQDQDERTERIINKLNRYIVDHLDKDLSLAVLADAVYLNPSYLSNLYKTCTGRNISDYITENRIDKSKSLLSESQAKVQDIAAAVGFDTAGYFSRFFKKHVGVTPQEYRSRLE
ncbi:two-component system, response regulator YesN [Cohnella sp. OV330]|uniref:response regulator transcription factor n=1 Tax=Cohnella sp. OV330 TaxID=1855288 RepID=UPI0008EF3B21|nr:response regulator [Cohnella sp. OV330]SFB58383.1 two-component system, response regulator YesN [Cohnella sp. OV330]